MAIGLPYQGKKKNKNNVKQYSMHLRDKVKVIHLCLTL